MLHVTERARAELKAATSQIAEDPDRKLRLGPTPEGKLAFYPDQVQEGDEVVEHEGVPVLVLAQDVAQALAGRVLDFEEREEGRRFALRAQA